MRAGERLSVVIPFERGGANLPRLLDSLAPVAHPEIEFLLCRTPADAGLSTDATADNLRWLDCAPGSRIPEMWRDGIVASSGDFVALLTAHCIPDRTWLARLQGLVMPPEVAGVGGHFVNEADASAVDKAIFLLRYSAFSRPVDDEHAGNIAADNAVYRRDAVMACAELLPRGFWELEYHREFAARGLRLRLVSDMPVTHVNRYTSGQFAEQRRAHGRQFGRDRARRLDAARLYAYLLATPAVPALLFGRVLGRVRRHGRLRELRPAVCWWLAVFCIHWALGEAAGVLDEIRERHRK